MQQQPEAASAVATEPADREAPAQPPARWQVMVLQLLGDEPPPAPLLPGRLHAAADPAGDDLAKAWDARHAPAGLDWSALDVFDA